MRQELSPLFSLHGRHALVTGGGRGIGKAIAIGLARAGADVALVGRDEERLNEVAEEVGSQDRRAVVLAADLTRVEEIPRLVARAVNGLGGLEILVNSAGVQITGPAQEMTESEWDAIMAANLKATFFCCQAAAKHFLAQGDGKIINLGSTFAVNGAPQFAAYCASKGGVLLLTRALAAEWAGRGVNVNALGPTATRTEMNRYLLDDQGFIDGFLPKLPVGRIAEPTDMIGAAVFLASSASDMVHGHHLLVDGGYTAI